MIGLARAALAAMAVLATAAPAAAASLSIIARDPLTGDLGAAVASHAPASGAAVPWARPEVGAAAVQAWIDPTMGERILSLLAEGIPPREALSRLLHEDPAAERRQIAVVDPRGVCVIHAGREIPRNAGAVEGEGFCAQGNDLPGPAAPEAMAAAYRAALGRGEPLADRLIAALEAGAASAGERGALRSAALKVVSADADRRRDRGADLRVDDADLPVSALRSLRERVAGRLGHRDLSHPSGPDVAELQALLRKVGLFDREPSGTFDDATAAAVDAFRRTQGLSQAERGGAGRVDAELLARLRAVAAGK